MASLSNQVAQMESELEAAKYERDCVKALLYRLLKQSGGQLSGNALYPFTEEERELLKNGKVLLDARFVVKLINP